MVKTMRFGILVGPALLLCAALIQGCGKTEAPAGGAQPEKPAAEQGKVASPATQPGSNTRVTGTPPTPQTPGTLKAAPGMQPGQPGRAGGPRGMLGRRFTEPTAADLPAEVLQSALKLSADQMKKVQSVQQNMATERRKLFTPPAQQGAPQDQAAREQMREKMRKLRDDASAKVEAVLTPAQKKALPSLLTDVTNASLVGLPPQVYAQLKITDAQKKTIVTSAGTVREAIKKLDTSGSQSPDARAGWEKARATMEKANQTALGVLTAEQKAVIDKYRKDHPRRGFGGGGFGGPGGRGRGGPGGPGGGPGGAPPQGGPMGK